MPKKQRAKKRSKLGMAPGTPLFTGEQKMSEVKINLLQYNSSSIQQYDSQNISLLLKKVNDFDGISWINIDGLHDVDTVLSVCEHLGIHKLTSEDILSVGQRPKLDEHSNYLYVVLKMFQLSPNDNAFEYEQISFILKGNVLISFQEKEGDVFEHVRKRLHEAKGRIRHKRADYLLYALLDSIVDYYFTILEKIGDTLEDLEHELLENPDQSNLSSIHAIRKELFDLRRSIYPLREVISRFEKLPANLLDEENVIFVRDLYDHTIQVIESVEVFRESAIGLVDLYMNSLSNRMNNVMKVLTIIATIFIPLTFIAGIYGMNFEYMPELSWKYGYFSVMISMLVLALAMLYYFRKKKWI